MPRSRPCCCSFLFFYVLLPLFLQLPGSAHDVAVRGHGFTYDYIDPQYPSAAMVGAELKQCLPTPAEQGKL